MVILMRRNRKIIAYALSLAMCVTAFGAGTGASSVYASEDVQLEESRETAEADSNVQEIEAVSPGVTTVEPGGASEEPDEPSAVPTGSVTSSQPSIEPSVEPSAEPSVEPSVKPSVVPTGSATAVPPSAVPTPSGITTNSAVSGAAFAVGDEFTKGNYVYKVLTVAEGTNKATVKVKALSAAGAKKTSLTVQDSIVKDSTEFVVTGIHQKAFKTAASLKKVTIGKNVTFIGVRAFQGLSKLTTVTIGGNVTTIKKYAFAGCSALRKITLPAKVNLIGVKAFNNCSKLKAVMVDTKKLTVIKQSAFRNTKKGCYVVVPSGKKALYTSLLRGSGAKSMKVYTY